MVTTTPSQRLISGMVYLPAPINLPMKLFKAIHALHVIAAYAQQIGVEDIRRQVKLDAVGIEAPRDIAFRVYVGLSRRMTCHSKL